MARATAVLCLAMALAASAQQGRSRSSLLDPLFQDVPPAPQREAPPPPRATKAALVFDSITVRNNRARLCPPVPAQSLLTLSVPPPWHFLGPLQASWSAARW